MQLEGRLEAVLYSNVRRVEIKQNMFRNENDGFKYRKSPMGLFRQLL